MLQKIFNQYYNCIYSIIQKSIFSMVVGFYRLKTWVNTKSRSAISDSFGFIDPISSTCPTSKNISEATCRFLNWTTVLLSRLPAAKRKSSYVCFTWGRGKATHYFKSSTDDLLVRLAYLSLSELLVCIDFKVPR